MFSLRTFNAKGIETNQILGKSYTILYRHGNYEPFCNAFREFFEKPHVADLDETSDADTKNCYAMVVGIDLGYRPLFKGENNQSYIMSSDGKTYCNVTQK